MSKRLLLRKWLAGLGIAVGAGGLLAQDVEQTGGLRIGRFGTQPVPCPPGAYPLPGIPTIPCPTPYPGMPGSPSTMPTQPGTPGTTPSTPDSPSTTPSTPPSTPSTDLSGILNSPSGTFDASLAPSAGTRSAASIAPNLMGDMLGARAIQIGIVRDLTLRFPNAMQVPGGVQVVPGAGELTLAPKPGMQGRTYSGGPYSQLASINSFNQQLLEGQARIDPAQALTAQAFIQAALSGRQLTAAQVAALPPDIRAQLPQLQDSVNGEITRATRGLTVQNLTVGPVTGQLQGSDLMYMATLTGAQNVPFPGSGSTVGRIKMAEDTSPMPRDRLIFAYDHFDGVPFSQDGLQVNRFQFGIEKTFLDGRASFEFRLPFAGTLASTTTQGQEVTDIELGNLRFALKYLWTQKQNWHFSTGVAVTLPTANDVTVLGVNPDTLMGTVPLYKFENQSVQVEPFAGLLYTPNDRLFAQLYASVNFDVSGGNFTWNKEIFGGEGSTRIWDLPLLAVDYQIGYWLFRNDHSTIRGVAPVMELHWNYLIAQNLLVDKARDEIGNQGLSADSFGDHELNLTAGATTQIGNNMMLTLGGTAPLLKSPNRLFDAQFGLRLNYFFGRTARERTIAQQATGF